MGVGWEQTGTKEKRGRQPRNGSWRKYFAATTDCTCVPVAATTAPATAQVTATYRWRGERETDPESGHPGGQPTGLCKRIFYYVQRTDSARHTPRGYLSRPCWRLETSVCALLRHSIAEAVKMMNFFFSCSCYHGPKADQTNSSTAPCFSPLFAS